MRLPAPPSLPPRAAVTTAPNTPLPVSGLRATGQRVAAARAAPWALVLALAGTTGHAQAAGFCGSLASYPVRPLIGGDATDLCRSDAKALLVVNTASACGYTPQYEGLEKLHQRYGKSGLRVVAVPANDFGAQESGSNTQIAEFCSLNYGVSFTVTEKLATPIGRDPLFAQLVRQSGQAPRWNFHKYLIPPDGQVRSFASAVTPQSKQLTAAIEAALGPATLAR